MKGCDVTGNRQFNPDESNWLKSHEPPLDAIVAVVGYNAFLEGEEGATEGGTGDRHEYGLPGRQLDYLEH